MAKGGRPPFYRHLGKTLLDHPVESGGIGALYAGAGYNAYKNKQEAEAKRKAEEQRRAIDEMLDKRWKEKGYAEGGLLSGLGSVLDKWNEFMLPGDVEDPEMQAARTSAKEGIKRFAGSWLANLYGQDEKGNIRLPFLHDPKDPEPPLPGIVDQTLALPAWLGGGEENWPRSNAALKRTEAVEQAMRDKIGYTPADDPLEYFIEAGGSMAGQPIVPSGTFGMLKKPFLEAGKYARRVAGPVAGRIGQAASLLPRAGLEFFGPMIEPSAANYLMGTLFGGGMRTGLEALDEPDPEPQEESQIEDFGYPDLPESQDESFEYSPEQIEEAKRRLTLLRNRVSGSGIIESPKEETDMTDFAKGGKVIKTKGLMEQLVKKRAQLLIELQKKLADGTADDAWFQQNDEEAKRVADLIYKLEDTQDENGLAKGGKVKPPSLMELRKLVTEMMSSPNVEGTGKEMVPIDPVKAPTEVPSIDPGVRLDEMSETPGMVENLMNTPISRRSFLKNASQQVAGSMLPIDPMALLKSEKPDVQRLQEIADSLHTEKVFSGGKRVALSPSKLAAFLTDSWGHVFHGSDESAVLHEADRFDQLEGGEGMAAALREWYRRMETGPSYHDPNTDPKVVDDALEKLNEEMDLEGKFQDFARSKGLLVDPLDEWSEHGDMEFSGVPSKEDLLNYWETPPSPEILEEAQKLIPRFFEFGLRQAYDKSLTRKEEAELLRIGRRLEKIGFNTENFGMDHDSGHYDELIPRGQRDSVESEDLKLDDEDNAKAAKQIHRSREDRGDYGDEE